MGKGGVRAVLGWVHRPDGYTGRKEEVSLLWLLGGNNPERSCVRGMQWRLVALQTLLQSWTHVQECAVLSVGPQLLTAIHSPASDFIQDISELISCQTHLPKK